MSWLSMLELAVRLLAGGVLLVAGVAKLRMGFSEVLKSVVGYKLLPNPVAKAWARVLPPAEVALGSALIAGLFISVVAALAAVLMLLITVAVAQAVIRNRKVACGCFKSRGKLISWPVVVRNSIITAALLGLAIGGGNL
jgi:uncharacterized membrane protein YphA (DoxX/SURF4 family)